MSSPGLGGKSDASRFKGSIQSAASQISSLSIEENYFGQPQLPLNSSPQRPPSTDLPASLALPPSGTRTSTPNTATPLRAGPSILVDDDTASIRSFAPTFTAGDDLEVMLSEMLGSDTRWRIEHDSDIDIWEAESENETESDLESDEEPEDDGERVLNAVNARG